MICETFNHIQYIWYLKFRFIPMRPIHIKIFLMTIVVQICIIIIIIIMFSLRAPGRQWPSTRSH